MYHVSCAKLRELRLSKLCVGRDRPVSKCNASLHASKEDSLVFLLFSFFSSLSDKIVSILVRTPITLSMVTFNQYEGSCLILSVFHIWEAVSPFFSKVTRFVHPILSHIKLTLCHLLFYSHNRKTVMDFVNAKENATYLWNLAHFVSVLADNVIFCCGDLLPLLSSVTSRDYGQDVIEPCGGMSLETSFSFLNRLMSLVDVIVFTSSLAFSGVETNRNMSTGGFLRQCLRLGESKTNFRRNCSNWTLSRYMMTRWFGDVIWRTGKKNFNAVSHNRARS